MEALYAKHQGNVTIHAVNITDKASVNAFPKTVIAAHGAIDGVVHCAGIIQPFVKVQDLDFEAIEKVLNVNLYGTLYINKAFLPHLLSRPEAHLVNFSSMGGFLPVPGQAVYGASKAAVKLLTEALYAELLDTKVGISVVFPGATKTNITQNSNVSTPGGTSADQAAMASKIKMLEPGEVARLVVDGIEKNKLQIFTGKDSNFMNKLYRLSPLRATKLLAKQMGSLLK
jgi:short-subunit dehydrogenase